MTLDDFIADWCNANPFLHVHTSGSTGKPKDIVVEKSRMEASARMTCDFLGLKPGDTALLCMPLDYIAGKMVVVRSQVRNLKLISVEPSSTSLDGVTSHLNFAAMVPLQVKKSLDNPRLKEIDNLIIGGGAIDAELEAVLRSFPNKVYSTYGMTETLSHVALRRISGDEASCWYTPFEGVTISLTDEGCLVIDAPYVCKDILVTNDIAEIDDNGRFRILGRKDNVINSGGVKIQIEEVEERLRELSGSNSPFLISSRVDSVFGEIVVLLIPTSISSGERDSIMNSITKLPKYWQPKDVVFVDELPMTETSKPNRAKAKEYAKLKK